MFLTMLPAPAGGDHLPDVAKEPVPTFRSSYSIAAPPSTNFEKSRTLANLRFSSAAFLFEVPEPIWPLIPQELQRGGTGFHRRAVALLFVFVSQQSRWSERIVHSPKICSFLLIVAEAGNSPGSSSCLGKRPPLPRLSWPGRGGKSGE